MAVLFWGAEGTEGQVGLTWDRITEVPPYVKLCISTQKFYEPERKSRETYGQMTGHYEEKRNGDKNVHVYTDTPSNPLRVNGVPWFRA